MWSFTLSPTLTCMKGRGRSFPSSPPTLTTHKPDTNTNDVPAPHTDTTRHGHQSCSSTRYIYKLCAQAHLTQSFFKVVVQRSTPPPIRQLTFTITDIHNMSTDLCGNSLLQNDFKDSLCEIKAQSESNDIRFCVARTCHITNHGNQSCTSITHRALIEGSLNLVSLTSRLESNQAEERRNQIRLGDHRFLCPHSTRYADTRSQGHGTQ